MTSAWSKASWTAESVHRPHRPRRGLALPDETAREWLLTGCLGADGRRERGFLADLRPRSLFIRF